MFAGRCATRVAPLSRTGEIIMHFKHSLRLVSERALTLALQLSSCGAALAQESLPTIDIAAETRGRSPSSPSARTEPKTPTEAYVVRDASTATRTDVPVRQTPASIQVIPKQVLVDQQITNIKDALSNASGVVSNTLEATGATFYMRGFRTNYLWRNGLPIPQDSTGTMFDAANIERIEVLKGPASMLYGRSEPGGLVALVTKQPLDHPLLRIEQQIGSYDHYRTQWDISAPVAEIPGLAYRVSGLYQTNGSFRQFQGGRRAMIAPVVRYAPTAWTEFNFDSQFLTSRIQNDLGLPTANSIGALPSMPYWRSFQEANDPKDVTDYFSIGYSFRQNIADDWKITNRFLYTESRFSSNNLTGAGVDDDFRTSNRYSQYQDLKSYNFATNIDVNGKFEALEGKHDFLFGLDYLNNYYDYVYTNGLDNYPIDLYAPIYGTVPGSAFADSVIGSGFEGHSSVLSRQKGMYVQDHVTWLDRFHFLLGARYDIVDNTRGAMNSDYSGGAELITAPNKEGAIADRLRKPTAYARNWSPRVGVSIDVLDELSVYASYSRSFGQPNNGFGSNGQPLPPQKALQWEVGVKAEPLPGLLATLALYEITKSNVSTPAFTGLPQESRLTGLQRSRGVELDIVGKLTERMTIVANYAYTAAFVIDGSPFNPLRPYSSTSGFIGKRLDFAPPHLGKLFLTYDFGENGLGFRVGGGVTASSSWFGDLQNIIVMPSYARLDAFASYGTMVEGHKVTAQINLQNLNNVRYFETVDNFINYYAPPFYRIPAAPFRAVGSLRFEW
jgi:iron complex outermembrane receptor protein